MEFDLYLFYGGTALTILAIVVGLIFTLRSAPELKSLQAKRFLYISAVIFALTLMSVKVHISPSVRFTSLNEFRAENLTSSSEMAKFENAQSDEIEKLKAEVESLRANLSFLNEIYGTVLTVVCSAFFALSLQQIQKINGQMSAISK